MTTSNLSINRPYDLQPFLKLVATCVAGFGVWIATGDLLHDARWTLLIFWFAIAAWLLTPWDDAMIALSAAVALIAVGGASEADLRQALGADIIWLLIAALMIAAAIRDTTLIERLAYKFIGRSATLTQAFHALTAVIAATAFFVPSTSARAALLLPVFLQLVKATPDVQVQKALSLLFPTVILLSAGGVLTGAGAHLIAIDLLGRMPGSATIGYFEWIVLCLPIALATSHAAAHIILRLFAPQASGQRFGALAREAPMGKISAAETYVLAITAATLALWMTTSVHGFGLWLVAVASALALSVRSLSGVAFKSLVNGVDCRLILFLAATIFLGHAMLESGAGRAIADGVMRKAPEAARASAIGAASIVILVALLSHLVIVSRSARAAVLIPAFALPFAALGFEPEAIVMLTIIGTGFCQTFPVSAKPVAIFAGLDGAPSSPRDLLRLSIALFPMMFAVLLAFSTLIWPLFGFSLAP